MGIENLVESWNPAVTYVCRWYDGVKVGIDIDGNCWGTAWLIATLLWAVQAPGRITLVIKALGAARDTGAFQGLTGDLQVECMSKRNVLGQAH